VGITQKQYAEQQERAARAEMPQLNELADNLEALARDLFQPPVAFHPVVGADVMALSFATKQFEHLRSVRVLISAGLHRDAYLIARTMLEGYGRLRWAFNKVPDRTELWFWYGTILDWRQMAENKSDGMPVNPSQEAELKTYVDKHGPNYFKGKVRDGIEDEKKSGTAFKMPDDPWENDWTSTDVRSMFVEFGEERVYDSAYRRSSEWVHWGPRAIMIAMDPEPNEPAEWSIDEFTEEDWVSAALALGLGCHSLLMSLQVVDREFSLGASTRVAELEDKMQTVFRESLATMD
jgi:hypothetical protein